MPQMRARLTDVYGGRVFFLLPRLQCGSTHSMALARLVKREGHVEGKVGGIRVSLDPPGL